MPNFWKGKDFYFNWSLTLETKSCCTSNYWIILVPKCHNLVDKMTPLQGYRLLSYLSNKQIVFIRTLGTRYIWVSLFYFPYFSVLLFPWVSKKWRILLLMIPNCRHLLPPRYYGEINNGGRGQQNNNFSLCQEIYKTGGWHTRVQLDLG